MREGKEGDRESKREEGERESERVGVKRKGRVD